MKKYIGNVFVSNVNYKVDECFKKCLRYEDIDETLPTLIIGLKKAKEYIEDFNILRKKYKDGMLWWTFSKMERRTDHDNDIITFHNYCINNIINNIKYYYINYINLNYSKVKKCLKYISNSKKKYYYVDNNKFIFVYDVEHKNIYGFSLTTSGFFGIKKDKIISLIERNKNNIKINNFFHIPNNIRRLVNNEIPNEMVLLEYF